MSSKNYYYRLRKHHCFMFITSLGLISNGIIWAVLLAWYDMPKSCIACAIAAVFGVFMASIEYRHCVYYNARYLSSLPTQTTN